MVKRRLNKFRMDEISAVDVPAQGPALAVMLKRDTGGQDNVVSPELKKNNALTSVFDGHVHLITFSHGQYDLIAGDTDYNEGHSHPWIKDASGNIIIGEARGHTHTIATIGLTKLETTEEENMSVELQKQLDAANARADRFQAIMSLPSEQAEFFKSLDEKNQDLFLTKSAELRASEVASSIAKAAADKEVVYTATNGNVFTKSDDPRMVMQARENDELRKSLSDSNALIAKADLEKRAEELKHIPGDLAVRVALIKAVDGIADEALRTSALAAIEAKDKGLGKAYTTVGAVASTEGDFSASDKLDALAKSYASEKKVTEAAAYEAVMETPEGLALYAEMQR